MVWLDVVIKVTATISRNGDLVHDCFIEMCDVFVNTEAIAMACREFDLAKLDSNCEDDNFSDAGVLGAGGKLSKGVIDSLGIANLGTALIHSVEVEIGGQQIDKHYGHWMETWSQLTQKQLLS